jgi:hypothetical protein
MVIVNCLYAMFAPYLYIILIVSSISVIKPKVDVFLLEINVKK